MTKINIIEAQFLSKEKPPKHCTYCDEEKKFLMVKPVMFSFKNEVMINVNHTSKQLWMCLECFSMELDMMGHSVGIYEYDGIENDNI